MTQTPSEAIAIRLKELRLRRGLSVAKLASICAELGMSRLNRAVLANMEVVGRRQDVGVNELLVLAQALDTSPLMLLLPEPGEELAITPESVMDVERVVLWFAGEYGPTGPKTIRFEKETTLIKWHYAAFSAEQRARRADHAAIWARKGGDEDDAARHRAESRRHLQDLAGILNSMIEAGVEPPRLNPGWAALMVREGWVNNPDALRVFDLSDLDEV
ncbi:hypothetical protein [Actinocorallia longicatena]|uniref:HTH cro/C1-type domain-containing protein n=1 Tax=Actinocorallia longicatena TaxID=111803 RepID=A0ABP6QBE9_9ACTN